MRKKELLALVVLCFAISAVRIMAASGISTTYININNKGSAAWYDLQSTTGLNDFNNYDFGSFTSSDTFSISGSEVNIWKMEMTIFMRPTYIIGFICRVAEPPALFRGRLHGRLMQHMSMPVESLIPQAAIRNGRSWEVR